MPWVAIANLTGPQGLLGPSAFTHLSDGFTVPEIGDEVSATVEDAGWMTVGQMLWVALENDEAVTLQVMAKNGNDITLGRPMPVGPPFAGPQGPPGPVEISADPGNIATLGHDNLLYVPPPRAGCQFLNEETILSEVLSGNLFICTGGAWTLHLPEPTPTLTYYLRNAMGLVAPTGPITLAPTTGQIDNQDEILLLAGQECRLFADGTNWRTFGRQRAVVIGTREITSPVANFSIQLPDGYTEFELFFRQIQVSTAAANLQCRVSTDRGATFPAANYYCVYTFNNSATTLATAGGPNIAMWYLTHYMQTDTRHLLTVKIFPGEAGSNPMFLSTSTMWNAFTCRFDHGGFYNVGVRINALQFHLSTGNIQRLALTVKGIV